MSIHAISGKPGGGKSMYATKMVVDELLYGTRVIVTNLALNLGRLNEYLQKEFGWGVDIVDQVGRYDIFNRVRLLDDDETGKFWTYRPFGRDEWFKVPTLTKAEWKEGKKPSYAGVPHGGVMYVIDECHNFFNARAWEETGRDVLFYLSQHRKLGDNVIWITQAIMNVDKQFRSVTQDYTYLRNLTKEKMGLFRLPAIFVRRTYLEPASANSEAMETGTFKLNVSGLGSLYNTAAGVGIHDRVKADVGERRTGIHWIVPALGIPCVILAIYLWVPGLIARFFDPRRHHAVVAVNATNGVAATIALPKATGPVVKVSDAESVDGKGNRILPVDMIGWATLPVFDGNGFPTGGKLVTVELSDGTEYQNGDGHLQYLCSRYCVVDGATNWYRPVQHEQRQTDGSVGAASGLVTQQAPQSVAGGDMDGSQNRSVVYVIPQRAFGIQRPSVRSAVSGYSQGFSQSY